MTALQNSNDLHIALSGGQRCTCCNTLLPLSRIVIEPAPESLFGPMAKRVYTDCTGCGKMHTSIMVKVNGEWRCTSTPNEVKKHSTMRRIRFAIDDADSSVTSDEKEIAASRRQKVEAFSA